MSDYNQAAQFAILGMSFVALWVGIWIGWESRGWWDSREDEPIDKE